MCTVRRDLLGLFLQVVCRRGQWQAVEGVFSTSELLGDELTSLVEGFNETFEQFAGGKTPLLKLAIDPAYTPLEETSQVTPVSQYT